MHHQDKRHKQPAVQTTTVPKLHTTIIAAAVAYVAYRTITDTNQPTNQPTNVPHYRDE